MKKIPLLLLVFASVNLFAQDIGKTRNWSLGTSLVPIFQEGADMGVSLKRYIGGQEPKGAIRLYTSYRASGDEANGQTKSNTAIVLNLGYEWIKHEGKFSVNYGADLAIGAKNAQEDGNNPYKTQTNSFGFKLFIGASYRINNRLSVSTELGKLLAGQNTKVYANPGADAVIHKGTIDDFFFGQLLMINYHF